MQKSNLTEIRYFTHSQSSFMVEGYYHFMWMYVKWANWWMQAVKQKLNMDSEQYKKNKEKIT